MTFQIRIAAKMIVLTAVLWNSWVVSANNILSAEPPNILFAIADDWGAHAGAYGTLWVKTPNFDRIAKEGLLFRNAYTPMAKCAPSRAIILTGRHLWQNEEAGNHMCYFPAKFKSWPEVLTDSGWHMGFSGKGWGPGEAKDVNGNPRQLTGRLFQSRKRTPETTGCSNIDYAGNFTDFLDAAPKGTPWCFWFGNLEPHRDYEFQSGVKKGGHRLDEVDRVPAYWPDSETIRHDMLDYAFEVEENDRQLGLMLAELERRNQLDNTIIIVTSDHGMPFPRCKGYAYRDSNHVPLAIRWPKGIPAGGRIIEDFVDFTDVAPTILDLAGISISESHMQPITGKSLRPILESDRSGQIEPARDHVLIGKERTDVGRPNNWGYPIRGIVTREFLYLRNYEPTRWPAGNPETGYLDTDGSPAKTFILQLGRQNRSDRFWHLNFGMRPADELYQLPNDPDCVVNLANKPEFAAAASELKTRMESLLKTQKDPRMEGRGLVFDHYKPILGDGFYEKYLNAKNPKDRPKAGWADPTDFEPAPLDPTAP